MGNIPIYTYLKKKNIPNYYYFYMGVSENVVYPIVPNG